MQLELRALPEEPRARAAALRTIALALGLPLADTTALLATLPVTLPLLEQRKIEELELSLRTLGVVFVRATATAGASRCEDHPHFSANGVCSQCQAPLCAVCHRSRKLALCSGCSAKRRRSRGFFLIRVAVLLTILFGVVVYALRDVASREARTDWTRSVRVAIVLVAREPLEEEIGPRARERASVLADKLTSQKRRYREGGPAPFAFTVFGPVSDTGSIPEPPADDGLIAAARYSWELSRFTSRIDKAAGVDGSAFDSRIYVLATRPTNSERKVIEGASQLGGRIGVVRVELDSTMVDLALFVSTHELFHTLGASDRYDLASGQPLVPEGLPEPEQRPLFPQRLAEVMARHRATTPIASVPPKTLQELFVGEVTARELRWH